jgi:hypothetical protein
MIDWEWESFEGYLTSREFNFSDLGPLYGPIKKFSVERNEKLTLVLETTSSAGSTSNEIKYPLGTVRLSEEKATLVNVTGETTVTFFGVQPGAPMRSYNVKTSDGETKQISSMHRLSGHTANPNEAAYTIEWLSNISSHYVWPDTTDIDEVTTKEIKLGQGEDAPVLKHILKSGGGARNCAKLNIAGHKLYLCHLKHEKEKGVRDPGFILYFGTPECEVREKIRIILSYLMGGYFAYLGNSTFCKDWYLKTYEAVSSYALGGRAYEMPPCPPASMGTQFVRGIDRDVLSRMATAIFVHYDALNFRSLHWALYHALAATSHIAPVHYGAAIEALQQSYVDANPAKFKTALLDGKHFVLLQQAAIAVIDKLPIEDPIKEILRNKVSNLNSKPQSVIIEDVMSDLGLSLSKIERDAWKHRNNAGHGKRGDLDESATLIRETKLLWVRFNRMLLAITGASNVYIDYYSFEHPHRKLTDAVPEK